MSRDRHRFFYLLLLNRNQPQLAVLIVVSAVSANFKVNVAAGYALLKNWDWAIFWTLPSAIFRLPIFGRLENEWKPVTVQFVTMDGGEPPRGNIDTSHSKSQTWFFLFIITNFGYSFTQITDLQHWKLNHLPFVCFFLCVFGWRHVARATARRWTGAAQYVQADVGEGAAVCRNEAHRLGARLQSGCCRRACKRWKTCSRTTAKVQPNGHPTRPSCFSRHSSNG